MFFAANDGKAAAEEDKVAAGAPETTVCGGIPWRSALTGVFFSQKEVSNRCNVDHPVVIGHAHVRCYHR